MNDKRKNYEAAAIEIFKNIAKKYEYNFFFSQGSDNRIIIKDRSYFQFGDFRVEKEEKHILVEFESGGGVTNLVKYWYCLKNSEIFFNQIKKPIILFHIYKLKTEDDYFSHLSLWDFLWSNMKKDIGNKMKAKRYTYVDLQDLKQVFIDFEYNLKK